ncbi:hypothetical protein [Nocardiopsis sp. TNDT3]|uniref:hypothetical protein n=1 Tax=Nocardiopsis sp. TNDT3 TaxID=2249354 RepID=UPI000E3CF0E8|nr:hypothetical protein [Nocardiopsis sp. TNDT3]
MTTPDGMTSDERAILALIAAAQSAGLDTVAEIPDHAPPTSVDIRVVRDGRVAAAVRARMDGPAWRVEVPARPRGVQERRVSTRYLGRIGETITADTVRAVCLPWLAEVPDAGLDPMPIPPRVREDVPEWMRVGWRARSSALGGAR